MPELNAPAEKAAQLIVAGDLTLEEISREVGISSRSLRTWRKDPTFTERIVEIRKEYQDAVRAKGIAVREHRIESYNRRCELLQRLIEARAADPQMFRVPGGDTGLVVVTKWERIPSDIEDEPPTLLPVHAFDAALFREWRELEKQAAQDLGQWTTKSEVSGAGGGALSVSLESAIAKIYGDAEGVEKAGD
jgi:transposase-like protein